MSPYRKLERLCEDRGVTVSELEHILHMEPGTLADWKKTPPSEEVIHLLSETLSVHPDIFRDKKSTCSNQEALEEVNRTVQAAILEEAIVKRLHQQKLTERDLADILNYIDLLVRLR